MNQTNGIIYNLNEARRHVVSAHDQLSPVSAEMKRGDRDRLKGWADNVRHMLDRLERALNADMIADIPVMTQAEINRAIDDLAGATLH